MSKLYKISVKDVPMKECEYFFMKVNADFNMKSMLEDICVKACKGRGDIYTGHYIKDDGSVMLQYYGYDGGELTEQMDCLWELTKRYNDVSNIVLDEVELLALKFDLQELGKWLEYK